MAMAVVTAMAMEIDGGIADSEGKSQSWKKCGWLCAGECRQSNRGVSLL